MNLNGFDIFQVSLFNSFVKFPGKGNNIFINKGTLSQKCLPILIFPSNNSSGLHLIWWFIFRKRFEFWEEIGNKNVDSDLRGHGFLYEQFGTYPGGGVWCPWSSPQVPDVASVPGSTWTDFVLLPLFIFYAGMVPLCIVVCLIC